MDRNRRLNSEISEKPASSAIRSTLSSSLRNRLAERRRRNARMNRYGVVPVTGQPPARTDRQHQAGRRFSEPGLRQHDPDPHAAVIEDYLGSPERLFEWSRAAGVLMPDEAVAAASSARERQGLVGQTVALREAVHTLLAARIDGGSAPPQAMQPLDHWVHAACRNRGLRSAAGAGLAWSTVAVTPWLPLERVALSALDDLTTIAARWKPAAPSIRCGAIATGLERRLRPNHPCPPTGGTNPAHHRNMQSP